MTDVNDLRRDIIRLSHATQEGHVASALSVLDIIAALYDRVMKFDPNHPRAEDRDRFVLSKGHGCLALYAVLADHGFFPKEALATFCVEGTRLEGHPNSLLVPGVEFTTGSLGHGICGAVGMALALKLRRSAARVFCLIGDGECCEGSVWEAAALAARFETNNLVAIVDQNRSSPVPMNISDIFKSFGWTTRAIDGHYALGIERAIANPSPKPVAVIAWTRKGHGCDVMEDNPEMWHHRSPKDEAELATLLESCP